MFWMVWSEGSRNVTYKHESEASARAEAERLTKAHGGKFYVLQSVACCERNDVVWNDCASPKSQPERDGSDGWAGDPFVNQ